jgi:hypothetical protein
MARIIARSLLLGHTLLLTVTQQGLGDDGPAKGGLARKYRALVQQLVSPNKGPITENGDGGSVRFPTGYDVKAQRRIEAARQVLHDNFEESLPYLVEALDDERYCMTIDWAEGDAYYNFSVGDICRNVIAANLEVYRDAIVFSDAPHWNRYNYTAISKSWWQARKGRTLAELQIEAIDWAIARRRAEPESQISERRKDELPALQKLRAEIAKSGKPAKSRRMHRMVTTNR